MSVARPGHTNPLIPWWPDLVARPGGPSPRGLPNKDVLSPAPCRLPGRGLWGEGGGAVSLRLQRRLWRRSCWSRPSETIG